MADIGVAIAHHDLLTIAAAVLIGMADQAHVVRMARRWNVGRRHLDPSPVCLRRVADSLAPGGASAFVLDDIEAGVEVGRVAEAILVDIDVGGVQHPRPIGSRVDPARRRRRRKKPATSSGRSWLRMS